MNIAILGYARQGQSSYDYWRTLGHHITICDENQSMVVPADCSTKLGPDYLSGLDAFDLIVRTPKLHPDKIVAANPESPNILKKVTTNTNEFFHVSPTSNIIGVTGTKGKGTTSSLITEMLRANGHRVHLGGNIGTPPLELLKEDIQPDDWVVLELANFQLIDCEYSPKIAVVLMIGDEHLDWHSNRTEYIDAKAAIAKHQTSHDTLVYFQNNIDSKIIADLSPAKKYAYFDSSGAYIGNSSIIIDGVVICSVDDIGLLGKHNRENICAAITAVWQVHQNTTAIAEVIKDFKGLPFRLEHRQRINGVDYYNDSFSSNPSATIAAITAIKQPKILILGGKDRGISLDPLFDAIQKSTTIKMLCLVGEASERIANQCKDRGIKNYVVILEKSMAAVVEQAQKYASGGDAIVLSPGFPSFDMFIDFEDRGNQFNDVVTMLCPYKQFIFDHYDLDIKTKVLRLHYSIDDVLHFVETYTFGIDIIVNDNPVAIKRACELLFLMAGVSYYKTYLPPEIIFNQNILVDNHLAAFLQKTYQKGLGEFYYVNKLNPSTKINFPVTVITPLTPEKFQNNSGLLVGVGGGKDSLLSIELLRDQDITTWSCNHAEKLMPLIDRIDTNHIYVDRTWDSQLGELNKSGAFNGHVPISAILACVGLVLAALSGKRDIVVSNESSANTPTLRYKGVDINHQYSKSLEFEKDFQTVLRNLFDSTKRYYSLLRPYTELAIAEKFATHFDKYADVFCSCNKAFTQNSATMGWCGKCAKCAFSYLVFAPFIAQNKLNAVFGGNNLLKELSLSTVFHELMGLHGNKPLECVGEAEECRTAYAMVYKQQNLASLPTKYARENYDYKQAREHAIPNDMQHYIQQLP